MRWAGVLPLEPGPEHLLHLLPPHRPQRLHVHLEIRGGPEGL